MKRYPQTGGVFLNKGTFLIRRVVEDDMNWRHERTVQFFKEFYYLNRSDVCIIAH